MRKVNLNRHSLHHFLTKSYVRPRRLYSNNRSIIGFVQEIDMKDIKQAPYPEPFCSEIVLHLFAMDKGQYATIETKLIQILCFNTLM